ncbi:MAG: biotin carboxylase [Dehalococcoidia bacterium]|nr:biotin carboxylase [Dehalococcoidia bacterium]
MFKRVLIANRGEIACRVIRTCKLMGIKTIALYSQPDVDAPHVWQAQEAYYLGAAPAQSSYLNINRIMDVARKCNADAIHPGYGFLSESETFARKCAEEGIKWIGPRPEVILTMRNKSAVRKLMMEADVPVVPGTMLESDNIDDLKKQADTIGYPLLVKASEGGGGIGITIAQTPQQLAASIETTMSRVKRSFGPATKVYFERYLLDAHHIECQVLGDEYGTVIHLNERECSIQRRYQKVVEETPSPFLDANLRTKITDAALKAARKVGYSNAGTVEFLVDGEKNFYFLEMNTRIQVEHGITELTTGIDIVEHQLRVASGEKLSIKQEDVKVHGHALECRIYAEDPNTSMPSPGKITKYKEPSGDHIRVDGGVAEGQEITIYYDPLLAKVMTWGENRSESIERMRHALDDTVVEGPTTNLILLKTIMDDQNFVAGKYDTRFMGELRSKITL